MDRSPLHAELITAPNVVNLKNVSNSFQIGVSNASLEDFHINGGDELHFWFIISDNEADQTADRPWGLTSSDYFVDSGLRFINSKDSGNPNWDISVEDDISHYASRRPDLKGWKAVLKEEQLLLSPGEYIIFECYDLQTELPSGYTKPQFAFISEDRFPKLSIKYYNNWVAFGPILKTPMVTKKQNVGIGTDDPTTLLEVTSPNSADMVLETTGGVDTWADFHLRTNAADWLLGSANWQNSIFYLKETRATDDYWQQVKLTISRDGQFGLGEGGDGEVMPNGYRLHLTAQDNAHLQIASNVGLIDQNKDERNLIKFGQDGDFQLMYKNEGYFGHSSLGMASSQHALGFYYIDGENNVPALEVECETGNTYIRGSLRIDGFPESTEDAALSLGEYGQLRVDSSEQAGGRFIVKNNGLVGIQNHNPLHTLDVKGDINLSGKLLINGGSPFITKTYTFTFPASGGSNQTVYKWQYADLSSREYVGIVAGYNLTGSQIDSNRVINWLYFAEDSDKAGNLVLYVEMDMDRENEMTLEVYGVFINIQSMIYQL